jgi:hypothetical protein
VLPAAHMAAAAKARWDDRSNPVEVWPGPADPRVTSRTRGRCRPKRASSELPCQTEATSRVQACVAQQTAIRYFGRQQHAQVGQDEGCRCFTSRRGDRWPNKPDLIPWTRQPTSPSRPRSETTEPRHRSIAALRLNRTADLVHPAALVTGSSEDRVHCLPRFPGHLVSAGCKVSPSDCRPRPFPDL